MENRIIEKRELVVKVRLKFSGKEPYIFNCRCVKSLSRFDSIFSFVPVFK